MTVKIDPYTASNGQVIDATEINARFNQLYTLQNGGIDGTNMDLTATFAWTGRHSITNTATTQNIWSITGNSLTTGTLAYLISNSSDTGTRNLVEIINDHVSATGTTALYLQQDSSGNVLTATGGLSGSQLTATFSHSVNAANSSMAVAATVAGTSAGDAFFYVGVTGGQDYSFGVDNSDSDKIQLCRGNAIGTTVIYSADATNGFLSVGAATAADSTLHVFSGSAGAVTAIASTLVTIEASTDNSYLSFLSADGKNQGIIFGDASANYRGQVQYDHNTDTLILHTAGAASATLKGGASCELLLGDVDPPTANYLNRNSGIKGAILLNSDGSSYGDYNVSSSAKNSSGNYTVNWETDFSSENYFCVANRGAPAAALSAPLKLVTLLNGSALVTVLTQDPDTPFANADARVEIIAAGTQ